MRRAWLLVLCLVGCDCQPKPTNDAGVDAGAGTLDFHFAPFGAVLRGDALERTGTFVNSRSEAVEVTLTVTGPGFSLTGPSTLEVPAGGEATTQVRFAPAALGAHAGVLTFGDGTEWPLQGLGIGPSLDLTPERIDLGTLPLYDGAPATAAATLTVRNLGLDAVPARAETALQFFFDVQSTSAGLPGELCVGDCAGTPFRVEVDALTVIPVALSSTSPGLKTWDVRVFSNDPTAPMRTVPVTAEVVARPTCQFQVPAGLAFGVLTAPERRELQALFENVGTEPCEVARIDLGPQTPASPPGLYTVVDAPVGPRTVAPGEVLRVTVRAWPQGNPPRVPLEVLGQLRLEVNHPDGFARVPLSAQLLLSCLTVTPTPVDFASVQTGCRSADRPVSLHNTCARSLVVTSATLPGFSSFSLSAALPRTLAPGDSVALTARYAPFAVGPARDVIDVSWLEGGTVARHTTVPLLGEANATGENTDDFPPLGNKLDVLLIIDDSCSMSDKAARLAAQLPRILPALQTRNIDFHLGVVDASGSPADTDAGILRATSTGVRWLTPATPALAARFAELTTWTGTNNAGESCEVPALAALTAPRVSDPLTNGGFMRDDAALEVLCITDASEGAFVIDRVLQVKGAGGRLRWDVIGPTGPGIPGCGLDFVPARTGHAAYTQATGGTFFDLCAADWSPLLDDVASQTTDVRTFFPLRATPDPLGSLPFTVTAAGQNVSQTTDGGTPAWAWESAPNAVRFNPLFAPAATDFVSISYPVSCAP